MCNRGLRKTPKHFFTTLTLMSSQLALLFLFKDKNEHFSKAAPIYNEVLKVSGFNATLKFSGTIATRRHR